MNNLMKKFCCISKAIYGNYYENIANVEILDESTLKIIKIKAIPYEGIHANTEYTITIQWNSESEWPYIYIDSEIFDKIKTKQYLHNIGKNGIHKGICIKNLSHCYEFCNNFKNLCNNKWENYFYYLIITFNNIQDFEKGNGIKSSYKTILEI